jgi:hypothetical protein
MEEIVADFINASKNQITTLGGSEEEREFFRIMMGERYEWGGYPFYKEKRMSDYHVLFSTFFNSPNISKNLKKRCIDYYVEKHLRSENTQSFIDNVLKIDSVRASVYPGQALVNAIKRRNDVLANYILSSPNYDVYDSPIDMTNDKGKVVGHECFAQHAYENEMPELARTIFEQEKFKYGDSGRNYGIATSFFECVVKDGKDYNFGLEIMSRYLKSNCFKGKYNSANFVTFVTNVINKLKGVNTPEIIRMYYNALVSINNELHDPKLAEEIEKLNNSYQNPAVKKQKIQRIHDVLSQYVQSRIGGPVGASLPASGSKLVKK